MEQIFLERVVTILVVWGRPASAALVFEARDVLLESDNLISGPLNAQGGSGFLIVILVPVLLLSFWYIYRLRLLLHKRKVEVQHVLDQITDGFIKLDRNFKYLAVNRRAGEMVHLDPFSMIGKNIWQLFPDMISTPTYRSYVDAMNSRNSMSVRDYYPPLDLWYESHIYPTDNGLTIFLRDITDYMHVEQRLMETSTFYKTIASSIPGSVICIIDKEYRYTLIEGDLIEKLGYTKHLMLHKKASETLRKERFEEIKPWFDKAFQGKTFSVELRRGEYDLLTRYVPLRDEYDQVSSIMAVSIDVTPLKDAERRVAEMNADLERKIAERTAALEEVNKDLESFTYSVAHDLRSPLRAVDGYAGMLYEDYSSKLDEEAHRLMSMIRTNSSRMAKLIDDLLAFSRLGRKEVRKAEVDMDQLIRQVIDETNTGKAIICVGDLYPVFGDASLLQNVIGNLLSNAIKYSSKKSNPRITISSQLQDNVITYSVSDNGVGFDMKYAGKLFGVFQRLHSMVDFEGTGVGLAIVYKIINRHGGKVWAEAKLNEGATFHFTLPAISSRQV